ncbi:MAG: CPBP family intramembrane metalloprotease [Acidobacteriota bacterium]|nr:CPBP family intramembrane metalloprotease [Acidobacteriota bacterium]
MNQQAHTSVYRRFRIRSQTLLRDNKWFILAELVIVLLVMLANLADFIPFSETPFLLLLAWLSLWLRGIGWRALGLKRPARWRNTLLLGIAVGVVYQFFSLYVLEPLIIRLTGRSIDLSQFTQIEGNVFVLCVFLLLVWTLAAFGEELVFRGYLMNRVAELAGGTSMAWAASLVVVSVLFGVAHLYQGISGVITNIAAGLVYGALYLSSGRNLWAPIITHGVYDTVALLLAFWGKYPGL